MEEASARLKPGVEWQQVDDEIVALDLDTSSYMAVNDTGAALWPFLVAGATESRLVEELMTRFDIEDGQARADVHAFLGQLRSLSLVEQ